MELLKKISDAYYHCMAQQGKRYKEIIDRENLEDVRILFENIPSELREEASKYLYHNHWDTYILRPMVIEAVLEYGTEEEVILAIRDIIPFSKVVERGNRDEILYSLKNHSFVYEDDFYVNYLCGTRDKEMISAFLKNKKVKYIADSIAKIAIDMRLYDLLFAQTITRNMSEQIIVSGNKELILAAINQFSSVGQTLILSQKKQLGLSQEEIEMITKKKQEKKNEEKFWAQVDEAFDLVR
jgi:hypothetical protein